jgi:hypothetical protein
MIQYPRKTWWRSNLTKALKISRFPMKILSHSTLLLWLVSNPITSLTLWALWNLEVVGLEKVIISQLLLIELTNPWSPLSRVKITTAIKQVIIRRSIRELRVLKIWTITITTLEPPTPMTKHSIIYNTSMPWATKDPKALKPKVSSI